MQNKETFQQEIIQGIPTELPAKKEYPSDANRAPKRKDILSADEKKLALRNALRYFPKNWYLDPLAYLILTQKKPNKPLFTFINAILELTNRVQRRKSLTY